MSMCIEAALVGGKLCWDVVTTHAGHVTDEDRNRRRAMISLDGGGSTVITIEGWDIRRAKRAKKTAVPNEVLAEALDTLIGGDDDDSVENA